MFDREELVILTRLAKELRHRGWFVAICTHEAQQDLIPKDCIDSFYGLRGDATAAITSMQFETAMLSESTVKHGKAMTSAFDRGEDDSHMMAQWQAALDFGASAIVAGAHVVAESIAIAQRLNIPLFIAPTYPYAPSAEFPAVGLPAIGSGKLMNRLVHWGQARVRWLNVGIALNRFRKKLGLPVVDAIETANIPQLCLFSKHVVARPADWPTEVVVCGFAYAEDAARGEDDKDAEDSNGENGGDSEAAAAAADDEETVARLRAFIGGGGAPALVDFGDYPTPSSLVRECITALTSLDLRAILVGSWATSVEAARTVELPDTIIAVERMHWPLLRRCSLVISNGTALHVAETLRAALPCIIFPMAYDQPFWAQRCAELGVGPAEPVLLRHADADALVRMITEVNNETTRVKATALADQLRAEDGVNAAANLLERRFQKLRNCGARMRDGGWQPDAEALTCTGCAAEWTFTNRRHHCRVCGYTFCQNCLALGVVPNYAQEVMVCQRCFTLRAEARDD